MRQPPVSIPAPTAGRRPWVRAGAPVLAAILALSSLSASPAGAQPETPLKTPWTDEVSPDNALPDYPRPQMVREDWENLNGTWQWAPGEEGEEPPFDTDLGGEILVPYPIESALSGVQEHHDRVWYRRTVEVPDSWDGDRVLLNFGAVDWDSRVWVNGTSVGSHTGGYDKFSFDVTDALREGENEIIVGVYDPSDAGEQPVGKQRLEPGGIWYTTHTGIWQTVWMEPVPDTHVTRLDITPDVPGERLGVVVNAAGSDDSTATVTVRDAEGAEVGSATGATNSAITVDVPDAHLWSPDDPYLYDVDVTLDSGDEVAGYTGMRSIEVGQVDGVTRPLLNGEYVFQVGTLDQGYWPDGISTAPTDEALRFDIESHKDLGFNTIRKHVKVEPDRWYYWADRLGVMVMQDMPSMSGDPGREGRDQFETELRALVDEHRSFPSIVNWIVFNEAWGQYDEDARITEDVKDSDPSRLVTGASGWHDTGNGDIVDSHIYVGPGDPAPAEEDRVSVLGEFGGYNLPVEGHEWSPGDGFGYEDITDGESLATRYVGLMAGVQRLERTHGLSAAIYTEITDVETELNGFWTYDRRVLKVDPEVIAAAHERLLSGEPVGGIADVPLEENLSLRVTTPGHQDRYLAHSEGLGVTAPVDDSEETRADATWRFVPGLADDTCVSVESVNFPGEYLRHKESRVHREPSDDGTLFAQDATWCAVPGLGGEGVSLRSYNFPDRYLRHYESQLWLSGAGGAGEDRDTSENYDHDVTWSVEDPWTP
ncbi:MAG TPA: AbfB domain-containing protein [Nocardiopsis listeri]|uniref:AbfB domain-containing protein n=1 Tax=Nocardiopsis listeri TaxID=53440 RepID=UPI001DEA6005|nr:AbfB domain-containing protein [Nocardiopsis listeri]HJE58860.1 AbfB domain-containing protein [Nocardiopsis listeri]